MSSVGVAHYRGYELVVDSTGCTIHHGRRPRFQVVVTWIALLVRTQEKRCRRQALSIRAMTRIIGFRSADAGGKNLKFRQTSEVDVGKVEDAENYSSGLVSWEAFRPGATCANATIRTLSFTPTTASICRWKLG